MHKQINMLRGGTKSLWVCGLTFKTSQPRRQKALCARLQAGHTVAALPGRWELDHAKDGSAFNKNKKSESR